MVRYPWQYDDVYMEDSQALKDGNGWGGGWLNFYGDGMHYRTDYEDATALDDDDEGAS